MYYVYDGDQVIAVCSRHDDASAIARDGLLDNKKYFVQLVKTVDTKQQKS